MTTIYISSTYEDLREYRDTVYKALRKSGYDVIAMEDYVATDERPVDKCLKDVEQSDIYVGIFAFRYGYVPPVEHNNPEGLSITELEFRRAETLKKPRLCFVVNESTPWPPKFVDALAAENRGDRINGLRNYLLTERMASSFSSPYELAALIQAAVTQEIAKLTEKNTVFSRGPEARADTSDVSRRITWDIGKDGSPYPGLMHFSRKYAPVFFGRDAEVREVLDRMRLSEGRFLIISGGSGTGKSSLVDAGVLPRIEENGIGENRRHICARVVPSQGNHPFDALFRPLHAYAERAGFDVYELGKKTAAEPAILPQCIREILTKALHGDRLVLFLDQMEELFTAQDADASYKFLTALYEAAQGDSLQVLATIRSDHLHHCHAHPEMLRVLRSSGHYPLGPVEPFMMADMIMKPAECAGVSVKETLTRRIVRDTGSESGSLPLLAFVLNQLFEKRSDHELSEAVYKNLGGVTGAIAQHADSVETTIRHELGAKASELLRRVFETLVIVKEESPPTRRRPLLADFPAEMKKLVDLLVRGRLLHTEGSGKDATVSLTHEKLFEAWPALRDYIEVNKKALIDKALLESRARKWQEMGKPWFAGLASHREYRDFQRWSTPIGQIKQYLSASKRARWLRLNGAVVVAVFLLTIVQAWQRGLSVEYTFLQWRSMFAAIHLEPAMADIKAGLFNMGDVAGEGGGDEKPVHEVRFQNPFRLGKHEVTFDEYDRFAIAERKPLPNDQGWGRGRRPVINVSWEDARDYAKWLSEKTGKSYRLPTEAEWEYAARSEGLEQRWSGTSYEQQLNDFAWYSTNSGGRTQEIGQKRSNALGLYDMSGNVWEWVEDCWHENYTGAPTDGSAWLEAGGGNCGLRVVRGGSWGNNPVILRASFRNWFDAGVRFDNFGFRLAQDID